MKLVDRQYFLHLPAGTVYCKFPLNDKGDAHNRLFGLSAPSIKGDTINDSDFYTCALGEDMSPVDGSNEIDTFFDMQQSLAKEVPFEMNGGRDGMFDDENIGFMIFSREEVQQMIDELQDALDSAYREIKKKEL